MCPNIVYFITDQFKHDISASCTIKRKHVDGLVQERRNFIANTLELRLSCTNPSIYGCQGICPFGLMVQCIFAVIPHYTSQAIKQDWCFPTWHTWDEPFACVPSSACGAIVSADLFYKVENNTFVSMLFPWEVCYSGKISFEMMGFTVPIFLNQIGRK